MGVPDEFKRQQEKTLDVLRKLLIFLQEGERYGVEIDPGFKLKLETGIKATVDEKLKVALIGGFSEGKTSIVAAWMEKLDMDMKIDEGESSDEVIVYSMEDFKLIDTPGLFGFKENINKEKYKDITRKHVSEAHLVLYVMDPTNPIKGSHEEELIWLFKDLNLLPRTVFVLSRFDEEANITVEDDYKERLETKRQNIIGRLKEFGIISNDDIAIVAVSPNPFKKGVEYWLSHLDEFRRLSHIESLQTATTEKIKAAGDKTALIEESKKSIAIDILKRELPVAKERDEKTRIESERLQQECDEKEEELKKVKSDLIRTRIALREFITQLFTDLILQVNGLSFETISAFFQREIGNKGIVLSTKIKNEFERQLHSTYLGIKDMQLRLDAGIEHYNDVIGKIFGDNKKIIFDIAEDIGDLFDVELPIDIPVDIIIDLVDKYSKAIKEEEFKNDIVPKLEKQREKYLEFIDDENKFICGYFPNYINLQKRMEELHTILQDIQLQHENFIKWREMGEAIEAEFTIIS